MEDFSITDLGWSFRNGCSEQFSMLLAAPVILVSRTRQMADYSRREQRHEQREEFPLSLTTKNMFVQEQIAEIRQAALMLKKRLFVSNT